MHPLVETLQDFVQAYAVLIGVSVASVVVFVTFLFSSKDRNGFEQAFDADTRKLWNQDNEKNKAKHKNKSSKKGENKKEQEAATPAPQVAQPVAEVSEPVVTEAPPKKAQPVVKQQEVAQAKPEVAEVAKKVEERPVLASISTNDENKKKKKNKPRKSDNSDDLQNSKETHKKHRIVCLSDLDTDKVLTRFAEIKEVEAPYIDFLASYFEEVLNEREKLRKNLEYAKRAEEDLTGKVHLHQTARATVERQLKDLQRTASEQAAKLQQAETNVKQSYVNVTTIQRDSETLKASLVRSQKERDDAVARLSKVTSLEEENRKLSDNIAKLEAEIKDLKSNSQKTTTDELDQVKKEFELLITEFRTLENTARQQKLELDQKSESADKEKREALENLNNLFSKERVAWEKKEAKHMEEYQNLQGLISELNKEVEKFEIYKKEQDAKTKDLAEKENRLVEKEKIATEKITDLTKTNVSLKNEIDQLRDEIARLSDVHANHSSTFEKTNGVASDKLVEYTWKESWPSAASVKISSNQWDWTAVDMEKKDDDVWCFTRFVDIKEPVFFKFVVDGVWKNSDLYPVLSQTDIGNNYLAGCNIINANSSERDDVAEEMMLLKRTENLQSAPSNDCHLVEEIETLKKKNEELRERNQAVLAEAEKLEKSVSSKKNGDANVSSASPEALKKAVEADRKKVVASISAVFGVPPLAAVSDDKEFNKWISGLEKVIAKSSPVEASNGDDNSENYRNALTLLSLELNKIESMFGEERNNLLERVRTLESQLQKSQISELRSCLSSESTASATPSVKSAVKSDESDWEMLN